MVQSRSWLKIGALVAFSSAGLCCAVLTINLLTQDKTAKAGIVTLTFNFTDIHLPNPLIKQRAIPGSDLIQSLQSDAASVLTVATAAAGSKIQSAIGAVETAVEAKIPRNCSLGTRQFCVGFSDHTNCTDLSSDISDIIPEAVIV
ncbi:hypothetical protein G7Y89_g200 [Cudoniella acicularis]|uniref:Uncharacterized protein n=1 Tax=Cudoniella acicularis TaxID=354080 RepID=A0A8H4W851_9HELO|nr:hypothetical protein G7Y89_g200 [Cudoniella acicularis]